jgi:RNA polymerase sigma factor (sigma-70 family)
MTAHTSDSVLTLDSARSLVRYMTLRTGSAVFDEDLVQEALLRGLYAFRRTSGIQYPRAFFAKIVNDVVSNYWRRRPLTVSLQAVSDSDLGYALDLEGNLDRDRRYTRLHRALKQLPPRQRELIVLHYFEDLSLTKMSSVLGKSRSALKMDLLRTRGKIRQVMTAQQNRFIRRT